jgi:hypothetical protein
MSRSTLLLVKYLETYLNKLEYWLWDFRIAINITKSTALLFTKTRSCVHRPTPVQFFREPIQWVQCQYHYGIVQQVGVILDTRLTWLAHINEVGRKAAQILGVLGPLLNRSCLSNRDGVLLYKQLTCPMMDYGCQTWRSTAHTHVQKLQVLQSKSLIIANNILWSVSNRQIHKDLEILFFVNHIRALTESFDLKLANAGNPLVQKLVRRHLYQPRADRSHPRATEEAS